MASGPAYRQPEAQGGGRLRVLMVNDEWLPRHGGLSRFNKDLAAALVGQGHDVSSTALDPDFDDHVDARTHGVRLVEPDRSDLVVRPSQVPGGVDVVVGHARPAFAAALAQARQSFPGATLAVVVHTVPAEIAPFREGKDLATARRDADARTSEIAQMCRQADVVYGVGPHLTGYWQDRLGSRTRVRELAPGVDTTGGTVGPSAPGERRVLLLGRMQDWQIKGIDVAASAFAHLPARTRDGTTFVVMGAPEGTEAELGRRLHDEFAIPRHQFEVERFSSSPQDVVDQLQQASVLLMPSRAEGYGLVAHEAVSMGVPALVSGRSGFGELLARDTPEGRALVVPVTGDLDTDQRLWTDALAGVLDDPASHFDLARSARGRLATWPDVARTWTSGVHQVRPSAATARAGMSFPASPSVSSSATLGARSQRPPGPARQPGLDR